MLSFVATSRNDNHGQNLTYRMQHFVDGFVMQCKRHGLSAELILVEWNPPEDREPLCKALKFPEDKGPCKVRIIRVPKEVHKSLSHSDQIPLFQMIGKNVGIRRALGQFVLATNIDVLFSDALIQYLRDRLEPRILYRVDRLDVPQELPDASFDEVLSFCSENTFRAHGKFGTEVRNKLPFKNALKKPIKQCLCTLYPQTRFNLHGNACGDFTLLSSDDWARLRGYPEWNIFSWHLDSVFLFQAKKNGLKEVDLPRSMPIYHIEHGAGYTVEGAKELFQRLDAKNIPYLSDSALKKLVRQMKKDVLYNDENWGMSNTALEEIWV